MHEEGLIHYDLKSMNLLLTNQGTVKISDFGLGRSIHDAESGSTTTIAGTIPWMAPERRRGEKGSLASDIWSFSTIIWEVSTTG